MANPANEYNPIQAKEADASRSLLGTMAAGRTNPTNPDCAIFKGHEISANAASVKTEGSPTLEAKK